jgi:hypothetical protein
MGSFQDCAAMHGRESGASELLTSLIFANFGGQKRIREGRKFPHPRGVLRSTFILQSDWQLMAGNFVPVFENGDVWSQR